MTDSSRANLAINDRPIIGILTQPLKVNGTAVGSYLAASYVKYVESAGARAVALHFDAPAHELERQFSGVNGLVFPGGGASIFKGSSYRAAADRLWRLANEANEKNPGTFPVWGTCLGFQLMAVLAARDDSVLCLECYDAENIAMPLNFSDGARGSALLSGMPQPLFTAAGEKNLTANFHHTGIRPSKFSASGGSGALGRFFRVLSTNEDATGGGRFVSTMEAVDFQTFPYAASQWHPEKNSFEWHIMHGGAPSNIPHGKEATELAQFTANFFVDRSRRNTRRYADAAEEREMLIYNDPVEKEGPDGWKLNGYFEQIYAWRTPRRDMTVAAEAREHVAESPDL
jgi:gamma-glutamyl hydrolase